jgi:glycosyltransferase involved in cell wall biosynthesis
MLHKILMFGWELPPHNSGGLGVACEGILKELVNQGNDVTFVLPHAKKSQESDNVLYFEKNKNFAMKTVLFDSILTPYLNQEIYSYELTTTGKSSIYASNLVAEVNRYAEVVDQIENLKNFDIIHCHDWLTIPTALKAKEISHKKLIFHIHATEFDRTGGWVDSEIYEIEKEGLLKADHIIAVSNFTKQSIIKNYGINQDKIEVIHNGIDFEKHNELKVESHLTQRLQNLKVAGYQIILFTGRLTFQKGVDYLLQAAKKSLKFNNKSLFIIVGSGDMEKQLISQASELKISDRVVFTGFLRGQELKSLYQIADLFIMPSVSEPFGLVALESAIHKTPVIVSKQSGVAEIMVNSLKVDFWDVEDITDKMLAVLEYEGLTNPFQPSSPRSNANLLAKNWQKNPKPL